MTDPDARLRRILSAVDGPVEDDSFVGDVLARTQPRPAAAKAPLAPSWLVRFAMLLALASALPVLAAGTERVAATIDPSVLAASLGLALTAWIVSRPWRLTLGSARGA